MKIRLTKKLIDFMVLMFFCCFNEVVFAFAFDFIFIKSRNFILYHLKDHSLGRKEFVISWDVLKRDYIQRYSNNK
jgi:hypothetical protein